MSEQSTLCSDVFCKNEKTSARFLDLLAKGHVHIASSVASALAAALACRQPFATWARNHLFTALKLKHRVGVCRSGAVSLFSQAVFGI